VRWTCDGTEYWGWVKTPILFLAVCGPKFVKFWDGVMNPLQFPTSLPDCLCRVSFRRYSPLSLKVVEKAKVFWPPIFLGEMTPSFLRQFVSAIYCSPFNKFVWVRLLASPAIKLTWSTNSQDTDARISSCFCVPALVNKEDYIVDRQNTVLTVQWNSVSAYQL